MAIEKYSYYEFETVGQDIDTVEQKFHYIIYLENNYLGQEDWIESDDYFETRQEARFAAIDYINKLESGPDC